MSAERTPVAKEEEERKMEEKTRWTRSGTKGAETPVWIWMGTDFVLEVLTERYSPRLLVFVLIPVLHLDRIARPHVSLNTFLIVQLIPCPVFVLPRLHNATKLCVTRWAPTPLDTHTVLLHCLPGFTVSLWDVCKDISCFWDGFLFAPSFTCCCVSGVEKNISTQVLCWKHKFRHIVYWRFLYWRPLHFFFFFFKSSAVKRLWRRPIFF